MLWKMLLQTPGVFVVLWLLEWLFFTLLQVVCACAWSRLKHLLYIITIKETTALIEISQLIIQLTLCFVNLLMPEF